MKKLIYLFFISTIFFSCKNDKQVLPAENNQSTQDTLLKDGIIKIKKKNIPVEYLEYLTPMITTIKKDSIIIGYKILFLLDEKVNSPSKSFTKKGENYQLTYKFILQKNNSNKEFVYLYNYTLLKENLVGDELLNFEEFIKGDFMKVLKVKVLATNPGFNERSGSGTTTNEVPDDGGGILVEKTK